CRGGERTVRSILRIALLVDAVLPARYSLRGTHRPVEGGTRRDDVDDVVAVDRSVDLVVVREIDEPFSVREVSVLGEALLVDLTPTDHCVAEDVFANGHDAREPAVLARRDSGRPVVRVPGDVGVRVAE